MSHQDWPILTFAAWSSESFENRLHLWVRTLQAATCSGHKRLYSNNSGLPMAFENDLPPLRAKRFSKLRLGAADKPLIPFANPWPGKPISLAIFENVGRNLTASRVLEPANRPP
jgi:hypothetical protein